MSSPSGTNYQSVTIAGAWRQKDVGSAKRCVRWTRGIFSLGDIPAAAYSIVGSNDQTTWYLLDRVSNQNTTSINRTVNANYSQYSYRYYRWIEESKVSGSIYILNHWFGMFDENNAQLTTDGSFTASNGAGDVGGNSSTTFVIDSANGTSGTFNWQQTSNYASGPYTGPTSTLVYDPTQPVAPQPISVNVFGSWIQMDFGSGKTMTSYGMFTDNPPYAPVSWKMTGSNDGTTWYEIDRKSGLNWTQNATQNFSPSGFFAGTSYRYYRFIIQSIATGASVITPTRFYASDANGYIGWVGDGISTISSDLTNQRSPNNWNMNTTGGPTNFFGTSSYPSGTYNGSVSTAVFVPPSAPPAPTSLSASAGNGSVSISFTQGSDGGSAITNYKYSLNGGTFIEFDQVDTASPVVIGGLTNGVAYAIQLKAVNSLGDSDASASITVTPATIPDAPTNLVATYDGSGAVSISFTPGSNGGSTITNYQYSIDCGASFTPLDPVDGISPIRIEGLTNGQAYCIELKAENSVDAGIASSSVQYTAYGPVDAPTNLTWVDTLNGTISLSFTPGSAQGSAITNYEYSLDGGNTFTAFNPAQTTSPVSISGLNIRTHYSLVLRGVNAAPEGVSSATLNMYYMCFLEGTKILCLNPETNQEEYRAIETLRKGSLVKTVDDGYKRIDMIGTSKIYNPGNSVRSKNRLYKCSKENYPSLTEDLFITGCHSILVKDISEEERAELMDYQGKIYITDNHYRLIAAVDKRAEPHASEGVFNIWHMALENDNYYFNYGIYANGLLVETSSLRMMKEFSGMDLVQ